MYHLDVNHRSVLFVQHLGRMERGVVVRMFYRAADITPQNHGDLDHPNVNRTSITTRYATV